MGKKLGINRSPQKACQLLLVFGLMILCVPCWARAEPIVLASTSLAGAMARAAGANDVRVLTPEGVTHPPEYELKPSDLLKLEGATLIVYAGYERMVSKLVEVSRAKDIATLQIDTTMSPENVATQVRRIAQVLKTEQKERAWESGFLERIKTLRNRIAPMAGKPAVVHLQAQAFARWAGLNIVQVIKPGELTPRVISEAIAQKPEIVVDIAHMPVARAIAENAKCKYIQIINFPGIGSTRTLEDVFEYNARQLSSVFQP
jgi:zinc transport system substrate-binding protein